MRLTAIQQAEGPEALVFKPGLWARCFFVSAGVILVITAISKFISALGSALVLRSFDPIFALPFRVVFWIAGFLELTAAFVCVSRMRLTLQATCLAWLSSIFVIYRLGLLWVGFRKPCNCLG